MGWDDAIAAWLVTLAAAGRPGTTMALRLYQLRRVADGLAPLALCQVTGADLVAWVGGQEWSAETRRSFRSALRSFFGWAADAGHLADDPSRALPAVKPTAPRPRPAPEDAYRAALAGANARVWLMLRLAAELGMRRGEVARAHSGDLQRGIDGWVLTVHGKGGKPRLLPVAAGLATAIRERGSGYLFPGNDHGHLSPHYVGRLVSRALPGVWTMHTLRHRFGTVAFAVDRDLITVQELLGHASPVTTRRYVWVAPERLRATVQAVAAL